MSDDLQQNLDDETIYDPPARKQQDPPAIGPRGDHIELLEQDPDHLLYLIKGGGKNTTGIGCFALMWNLIAWGIGGAFFITFLNGNFQVKDGTPLAVFGLMALFPLIGAVFAFSWVNMKFGRTLVMVNRSMIGLQKDLLGWKKVRTLNLNPGDRGKLTVAYKMNNSPVHQIEFSNEQGKITFGTAIAKEEKQSLLDEIHQFLNLPSAVIEVERKGPSAFTGTAEEARRVLENNRLEIVEESKNAWLIRIVPRQTMKHLWLGFPIVAFAMFWEGFIIFTTIFVLMQGSTLFILWSIPFHAVGLFLWGMILYVLFGRMEIRLSKEGLNIQWFLFSFKKTSRASLGEIEEIAVHRTRDDSDGHDFLAVKRLNGKDIRTCFDNEWTPALATFLNSLLSDLRKA